MGISVTSKIKNMAEARELARQKGGLIGPIQRNSEGEIFTYSADPVPQKIPLGTFDPGYFSHSDIPLSPRKAAAPPPPPRDISTSRKQRFNERNLSTSRTQRFKERDLSTARTQRFAAQPVETKELSKIEFEDNVLSAVDTSTYKFTLFMTIADEFNKPSLAEPGNRVIIAESGNSARYFLKSVDITSTITPTFKLKNTQHNAFAMEIVEPKGFSLMDAFLSASEELGIPNYMFAPYYLQLDFISYDENGIPHIMENSTRLWSIKITNLSTSTTGEGTTYQVDAIEFEHQTLSDHAAILDTNHLIKCDTVGTFYKNLEASINKEAATLTGFWREFPDSVRFEVDEEIASLSIRSAEDEQFAPSNSNDTGYWQNNNRINVPKGMAIPELSKNLMIGNRDWVEKYLYKPEAKSKTGKTPDTSDFHKIWLVEPNMELGEYDTYINRWAYTYVFKIKSYTSIRKFVDPTQLNIDFSSSEKQEKKLRAVVNEFIVRKKYEYIYTGKNTEVFKLDFDMNFLWVAHLPRHNGFHLDNAQTDGPRVKSESELKRELRQFRSRIATAATEGRFDDASTDTDDINTRLKQEFEDLRATQGLTEEQRTKLRERIEASRNKTRIADTFVETLPHVQFDNRINTSPLPTTIAIDGNYSGADSAWMSPGTISSFRSIAASVVNNIEVPTADLLQIDLGIKGDPYWLGRTRTETRLGLRKNSIETNKKDNVFVMQFRIPTTEDENGYHLSANSDVITGVYSVITINHSFNEGIFTQELHAVRDYNTNILLTEILHRNGN